MAAIGLRFPVAATVATETRGASITYGTGRRIGAARSANLTFERNTDPFYGDDIIQDRDNGITGGTLEFETTQLTSDDRAYILGETAVNGQTGQYDGTDAAAPYVGFGFIRVVRNKDMGTGEISVTYEAWWLHKVQFGETGMTGATKEDRLQWQAPTLNGQLFGVNLDNSGHNYYYRRAEFSTEGAAIAFLANLANLASTYSTTAAYNVGDLCIYEGAVYRCISKISSGEAWTAAHWEALIVA